MDNCYVFIFTLLFIQHIYVPVSSNSSASGSCSPGSYHVTTNGPCKECPDGWYGDECQEECNCFPLFSKGELCNKTDGSCACLSGWAGKECTEQCPAWSYGDSCEKVCDCSRANTKYCHHVTGKCVCEPAWEGKTCVEIAVHSQTQNTVLKTLHTCQALPMDINCGEFRVYLKETRYGMWPSAGCKSLPGEACLAKSITTFASKQCLGKTKCQILATDDILGEKPCPNGSNNTLEVSYVCGLALNTCTSWNDGKLCTKTRLFPEELPFVHTLLRGYPKTVAVCERSFINLRCSSGRIVVIAARYGRWEDALCTKGESCLSKGSLTIAKNMCLNKAECTFSASNSNFGDPCVGIHKTLEISYYCDLLIRISVADSLLPFERDSGQDWGCHSENTARSIPQFELCFCKTGYSGAICDKPCPQWTWGEMCSRSCNCNSSVATSCNNVNGACTCKPGWMGASCETACKLPSYGIECSSTCFCDLNYTESCSYPDGTCQCKDGYTGTNCTHQCTNSTYGKACNSTCNCTAENTQYCNHINGACVCRDGYTGTTCSEECTNLTYGHACNSTCNCTAANIRYCNHVSGACVCDDGFTGTTCSEECTNSTYGYYCNSNCNCKVETTQYCDHVNGTCVCRDGYTGTTCSEVTLASITQAENTAVVAIVLSVLAAVVFLICVILLILWKCFGFTWKKWKEIIFRRKDKKLLSGASIPPLDVKEPHTLDDVHNTPVLTRRTSTFKDEFAKATRMKFTEDGESSTSLDAYYYAAGIDLSGDLNEGKPKESIQTSDYYYSAFANFEEGIKFSLGPNDDGDIPKSKSNLSPTDYNFGERRASKTASIGKRSRSPSPCGRRSPKVPLMKIPLPPNISNTDQKPQTELNSKNVSEAIYNNINVAQNVKSVDLPDNKDDKGNLPEAIYDNTDVLQDAKIADLPENSPNIQEETYNNIDIVKDAKMYGNTENKPPPNLSAEIKEKKDIVQDANIDHSDNKDQNKSHNEEVLYDVVDDITQESVNSISNQNEDVIYDNVV